MNEEAWFQNWQDKRSEDLLSGTLASKGIGYFLTVSEA